MPLIQPQKTGEGHVAARQSSSLMSSSVAAAACVLTVVSVWLSLGAIGPGDSGAARLALLPVTMFAFVVMLFAGVAVVGLIRIGASPLPLLLLVLVFLPWLPLPVPPVFLLWSGPMLVPVWVGVAGAMLGSVAWRSFGIVMRRPAVQAGLLALAIFGLAAWGVSPSRPGGDEPHYLIITQSLLLDHDLKIENNHQRGDYRAYFAGDLSKPDYLRRGRDGAIYSIHAPGVSALVAPAFAIGGYRGVVVFLLLLSATTAGLAWELTRRVIGSPGAAWAGWAAVVLSPTFLLNSFTVYPDGPGAFIVLTGVWALIRSQEEHASGADSAVPWLFHGAALAALPWLHTRFALLAGSIGALVVLDLARTRNPAGKASAFLAVPSVSALAWIAFFVSIYGAPDPAIPYRGSDLGSPSYIPGGVGGLFFDQMYGLFVNAPVLMSVPLGMLVLGSRRGSQRRLAAQLAFIGVPYVLTVTHFAMWWAGRSSPARFLVPLLPALAIPAAAAWTAARDRSLRIVFAGGFALTAWISTLLVTVDRGRLAYFDRGSVYALWTEWAGRTADLSHALPAYFARVQRQQPGGLFFTEIAVWLAGLGLACLAVRAIERRGLARSRGALATCAGFAMALAAMTCVSVVWKLEHVDGGVPAAASMNLLRHIGRDDRILAIDLTGRRLLSSPDLVRRTVLRLPAPPRLAAAREDRALFALPAVPAGEYRLGIERGGGSGWLMAGVGTGRDQFALVTERAEVFDGDVVLRFPVDVRALVVRGDEDARAHVRALFVRPVTVQSRTQKAANGVARRAARYGRAVAFFMDDRSFPEPGGIWLEGASDSAIVLQPDSPRAAVPLQIRNAPVDNVVVARSGGWNEVLRLAPGEERRLEVPVDPSRGVALVTFEVAAGFRPNAVDATSRDTRFLGAFVRVDE